jgi:hypothetical protein
VDSGRWTEGRWRVDRKQRSYGNGEREGEGEGEGSRYLISENGLACGFCVEQIFFNKLEGI